MAYMLGHTPIELIRLCKICRKATTLWCSRCKSAFYCSQEHIASDWPRHRLQCKPMGYSPRTRSPPFSSPTELPNSLSDVQSVVQAVWFPPNEESWAIVNVICSINKSDKPTSIPALDRFLHATDTASVTLFSGLNALSLRCPLQVWYSLSTLELGAPANRSISKITHGLAELPWSGTVVVLKFAGKTMKEHIDIDAANDLPAVVDFFIDHKRWPNIPHQ